MRVLAGNLDGAKSCALVASRPPLPARSCPPSCAPAAGQPRPTLKSATLRQDFSAHTDKSAYRRQHCGARSVKRADHPHQFAAHRQEFACRTNQSLHRRHQSTTRPLKSVHRHHKCAAHAVKSVHRQPQTTDRLPQSLLGIDKSSDRCWKRSPSGRNCIAWRRKCLDRRWNCVCRRLKTNYLGDHSGHRASNCHCRRPNTSKCRRDSPAFCPWCRHAGCATVIGRTCCAFGRDWTVGGAGAASHAARQEGQS